MTVQASPAARVGTEELIWVQEANRAWVRDLLIRKDRQFAELLEQVVRTEVLASCAQATAAG